jgi:hypothetical protein
MDPPLTYHDHVAVHEVGHKVYYDGAWKYHYGAANEDGGTTVDYVLSPTRTMSSSMKSESGTMHTKTVHGKYHYATAADGVYHHEPMNKMIKRTSETLSNMLPYIQMNYHVHTSFRILVSCYLSIYVHRNEKLTTRELCMMVR